MKGLLFHFIMFISVFFFIVVIENVSKKDEINAFPMWCSSSVIIANCTYKLGEHDCPGWPTPLESDCNGLACNHLHQPYGTSCATWQSKTDATGSEAQFMISSGNCSFGSHIVVVVGYSQGVYSIHHCANEEVDCLAENWDNNDVLYYYIKKLLP